jgi:ABC-type oligopeptide transport system ATPase subunit
VKDHHFLKAVDDVSFAVHEAEVFGLGKAAAGINSGN